MIVCLGWGSLIWDPRELPVEGEWQEDGPPLPIEFVRQSNNGRLTLVIDPESKPVPVLWAELAVTDLSEAVERLRIREETATRKVGCWPNEGPSDYANDIGGWAARKSISGVVWTALGPKFADQDGLRPCPDQAINYLRGLAGDTLVLAREYVEKAPKQIDTDYRRAFTAALGWVAG